MDNTFTILLVMLGTAVLTSLLTVALLVMAGRRWLVRLMEQRMESAGDEMRERVKQGTLEAGDELLPRFKAEVKAGFAEAAEEILPRLRSEVEQGVRDGADAALPEVRDQVEAGVRAGADAAIPQLRTEVGEGVREALLTPAGSKLLGKTQERLAKKGSSVLEAGLSILLGPNDEE